ncbi:MAG TPA: hypothetical protein GXZ74_01465 [Tissierellia bacterium]|nr:hypothetical protein [Tissierellia bacterium]
MRFGKTLSSLQIVKELGFKRTIIVTHRPVVRNSWFEDFRKIFKEPTGFYFGSTTAGLTLNDLMSLLHDNDSNKIIYFASLQDLRESRAIGGLYNKNEIIFNTEWDLVIIDDINEIVQTKLVKNEQKYPVSMAYGKKNKYTDYLKGEVSE